MSTSNPAIYYNSLGQITFACSTLPEGAVPPVNESLLKLSVEDFNSLVIWKSYVKNKVIHTMPVQPSLAHVFNYTIKQWELDTELAWQQVRNQRDNLLVKSDWTQLPDVPLATKEVWSIYRQELRDITLQTDPSNIIWPTKPT